MTIICPKNRIFLAAGVLMTALFGVIPCESTRAECGGYVTIGNKAKLRELQAKGYLPSEMKADHEQSESNSPNDSAKRHSERVAPTANHSRSTPVTPKPCDGPSCKSGKRPSPVPSEFVLTLSGAKSAVGSSSKRIRKENCSGFIGFRSFDETPISTDIELDRPPE